MNIAQLVNHLWMYSCLKEYKSFTSNLGNLKNVQERILLNYIHINTNTAFGKKHHYSQIQSYADFIQQVPVIESWEQVSHFIQEIEHGKSDILSSDPVFAFEETSGSTGFSKLIPYNKSLKNEFGKALNIWMYDTFVHFPKAFKGKAFWSISPALKEKRISEAGIPIGLENDTEYLSWLTAKMMKLILASPQNTNTALNAHDFYLNCVSNLLIQKDLSFVSIWSPTYFLVMDDFLREHWYSLVERVGKTSPQRQKELLKMDHFSATWKQIWPKLALLSCWTNAQSAVWIPALQHKLGNVKIQGKGLMSTEGVVSFPYGNAQDPILAYQSHFFEFREIESGAIFRAHELETQKNYEVILTTGSGLARYATGDLIQVTGFEQAVPYLTFLGRKGAMSDMVGEKLYEHHVQASIQEVFGNELTDMQGLFLIPQNNGIEKPGYLLVYESAVIKELTESQLHRLEEGLCRNPYYKQALNAQQIKPLAGTKLFEGSTQKLRILYQEQKKIKDGDLKLPILLRDNQLIQLLLPS